MVASLLTLAIPAFSKNAYLITASNIVLSIFGQGMQNFALLAVMCSWTTDWCAPKEKVKYFCVLMGAAFGAMELGPTLGSAMCGNDNNTQLLVAFFLRFP